MEVKNAVYSASFLKAKIEKINSTVKKLKEVSSKVRHSGLEKVNKVAFFQVEIKHTNQVTLELGSDYWAELTAEQALKVLQLRLEHYSEILKKIESAKPLASEKAQQNQKLGKEKVVKLQDGKSAILEVIGNENGEDIFNIVQTQQENDQSYQQKFKKIITKGQETSQKKEETSQKKEETLVQTNPDSEQNKVKQEDIQNEDEENQQAQSEDNEEQWNQQATDIIQEITARRKNLAYEEEQQQQNKKQVLQTIPEQPLPKVTFSQTVKVNKDQKKTVKMESKQPQPQVLPARISKFKLQKMKERLLKQIQ